MLEATVRKDQTYLPARTVMVSDYGCMFEWGLVVLAMWFEAARCEKVPNT